MAPPWPLPTSHPSRDPPFLEGGRCERLSIRAPRLSPEAPSRSWDGCDPDLSASRHCDSPVGSTSRRQPLCLSSPHHPSNFLARWPCRVIEGRVVDWEGLEGGDGRDRDDGGRDWGRLGRALAAAEQEAARRFGFPCGDPLDVRDVNLMELAAA